MMKKLSAFLLILMLLPALCAAEMLDLSLFEEEELLAAEVWEDAVFEKRPWYEREDGSDWRYQDDGSVIVTISATGDVTIGFLSPNSLVKYDIPANSFKKLLGATS